MGRRVALSFVAFTVVACQAVTGDFAVDSGEGNSSDGGNSSGGGGGSSSGGSGSSSGAGSDSGGRGESGAGGDGAGADACVANGGTGAVGSLGCPCLAATGPACNGNAQTLTLLCSGGTWVSGVTCASGQVCDSQLGSNQGTCQPIDPNCANANPGDHVCGSATTVAQCGPDLVSDSPIATCTSQACVSGACTGTCTPGTTQCASAADGGVDGGAGNAVATCGAEGTWSTAVACSNSTCVSGMCSGSCTAGATQCSGTSAVQSCASGMWAAPTACAKQACASGACTGCLLWALGGIGVPAGTMATASSSTAGHPPASAIDGSLKTNWNAGADTASLLLQFPSSQALIGVRLLANAATSTASEAYTVTAMGSSTVLGRTTAPVGGASGTTIDVALTPGAFSGITIAVSSTVDISINEVSLLTTACP